MAKRLILTRHAKSSWEHDGPDHERPLNARGLRSAPLIAQWLKDHAYLPGAVLSSSAKRTQQTNDALDFKAPTRFERSLYLAEPETMLAELRCEHADCVLMLGHNPGIAIFAEMLVTAPPDHPRFFAYPTCATTVMDFEIDDWKDLQLGSGHVLGYVVPRELE